MSRYIFLKKTIKFQCKLDIPFYRELIKDDISLEKNYISYKKLFILFGSWKKSFSMK